MGDNVLLILIFCVTVVAIVGIVALVVYNREQFDVKIAANLKMSDKIESDFLIKINNKQQKKK